MNIARVVDRWFWAFCVGAVLMGLFLPEAGAPIGRFLKPLLGSILFFTGLRLDFTAAWKELKRPPLILYAGVLKLVVLPLGVYAVASLVLPRGMAVGVMIVAAMPSGTACAALTDIVRGNAALALVGTVVTSLACPLVAPVVIEFGTGQGAGSGVEFLLRQTGFLAVILFVPLGLALAIRRAAPGAVFRRRETFATLAMFSLFLLIFGAMSTVSGDFKALVRENPGRAAGLFGFMCMFSATLHVIGYFLAPWRSVADRAAMSVNAAYVNNALAIVFATEFFKPIAGLGASAVLPAILLEVPMVVALVPLKAWVKWKQENSRQPSAVSYQPETEKT